MLEYVVQFLTAHHILCVCKIRTDVQKLIIQFFIFLYAFELCNVLCYALQFIENFNKINIIGTIKYEGRLQSSWTHIITPSWNFVEVR
jgi:hypothetical protein